ncbi:hypothetical protein [Streptomyces sp. NPDC051016]|uniref:hypothetical protein n=1 Tax=Streptomyces sp. NPDC051016 TaxID=3365638 RepID=UPI00378DE59B
MRYARELFAPLGAVVAVGALNSTGTWSFADVPVGAFLAARRQQWDRLFAALCSLCAFDRDEDRAAADETGRFRDYDLSAPLLLRSAGVTGTERRPAALTHEVVFRRRPFRRPVRFRSGSPPPGSPWPSGPRTG